MTLSSSPRRRPRVLHCVSHLALGGAERVAVTLMDSLHADFDFSVHAVRGMGDGEVGASLKQQLAALNIPLVIGPRIPMRFGGMITGGLGLARAVRRFRPEIIHLHTEIPEASYAVMVQIFPQLRKIPLVRTIHNAVIWKSWPALGRACDRQMPQAAVAGVSNDAVDAFLSLRSRSGAKSPARAAVTIYNGVRAPAAPSSGREVDQVIRMVYGGRFEAEKGTDLLPEILARTQLPTGLRAHLTIYGSGRHELALRWLASHPPPGWTVEVRPPVANFSEELGKFDIALVPSRHEGLALVAIEAVLAGIQVVATDASGLREALPPAHPWWARAGDPASFAAAIQYACANRQRWPAIAEKERAFALERFSLEKMAAEYRSLYESVPQIS
ncbi:MAG TPA: glycosyltransferase family 4 protein [Opitutus sp.]|nr:glycosyltransferase family 4 protein [Opitutus sp.]